METTVYKQTGHKKTHKISLPETIFGVAWQPDLVHEVVVLMQSNARAGTAHAKDRGEVSGGGRKPWRQKGTGRARHGSRRSPIWIGGGVTHGPQNEKNYHRKINQKTRRKALAVTLSKKYADQEIIFIDTLAFPLPRTAEAKAVLEALMAKIDQTDLVNKPKNAILVVLPDRDEVVEKSFRNLGNVAVVQVKDINPVILLTYKCVMIVDPKQSLDQLEKRVAISSKSK